MHYIVKTWAFLFVLGFISFILNSSLLLVFSNDTSVVVSFFGILAMSEATLIRNNFLSSRTFLSQLLVQIIRKKFQEWIFT